MVVRNWMIAALAAASVVACNPFSKPDPRDALSRRLNEPLPGTAWLQLSSELDQPWALDLIRERIPKESDENAADLIQALAAHADCELFFDHPHPRGCDGDFDHRHPSDDHRAQAIDTLLFALDQGTDAVKAHAAVVLGLLGESRAEPGLIKQLAAGEPPFPARFPKTDGDGFAFSTPQAWALRQIGPDWASLLGVLDDAHASDRARRDVAALVGMLGSEAAVEHLADVLNAPERPSVWLIEGSVFGLGATKSHKAVAPLLQALSRGRGERADLCLALETIGDPSAADALFATGILFHWEDGPQGLKCLHSLAWRPQTPRERVYAALAERDKDALTNDWQTTRAVLTQEIQTGGEDVIRTGLFGFIGLGRDDALDDLVALMRQQSPDEQGVKIANGYLNCGHPKLESEAKTWAALHGLEIQQKRGLTPKVAWGEL